jgi:LysM repeat protein
MAVLISVVSLGLIVGGLSLAFSESYSPAFPTATQSQPTAPILLTATPTANIPPTATPQPTSTNTPEHAPACNPPAGWVGVTVLPGDTLAILAARYKTTSAELGQANCLLTEILVPGSTLFVPPMPVNTPVPCGPPFGWVHYIVQPGDTLYRIATSFGITTSRLQQANCMGYSTTIIAGPSLWVPNVPTRTPGVTIIPDFSTPTLFPTEPLTETPVPFTSTPEPSITPEPSQTSAPPTEPPPTATITAFP